MGTGVRTFASNPFPHMLIAMAILIGPWPIAIAAGIAFATGRAIYTIDFIRREDRILAPVDPPSFLALLGSIGIIISYLVVS